jgi:hypothetical protein
MRSQFPFLLHEEDALRRSTAGPARSRTKTLQVSKGPEPSKHRPAAVPQLPTMRKECVPMQHRAMTRMRAPRDSGGLAGGPAREMLSGLDCATPR